MRLKLYQVDAFTSKIFGGNPAAVVPLESWLPTETMQALALENNLAETVFFVKEAENWRIRWFTPEVEIDLCGHATLASAWVLWNLLGESGKIIIFDSKSGPLSVTRDGSLLELDFPSRPPQKTAVHNRLIDGLGTQPLEILAARDYLVVYHHWEEVRDLQPDFSVLAKIDKMVIATAPGGRIDGEEIDFVSRFFAPQSGVPEDPVTGSAHSTLVPYWAQRLGKHSLRAKQISKRGGDLWCQFRGDRVGIAGECVLYLTGEFIV
jgi:PhzF family phenazine biosynthesis protein